MNTDPDVAAVAALIAVPARATILIALMDGRAFPCLSDVEHLHDRGGEERGTEPEAAQHKDAVVFGVTLAASR
ncbi:MULTISPECIES: hypothetical protein [Acidithiobacillus]|uniref:hypothetical protein n=1 Tax=Acidithiobacillus TaxID=119977 RepID=UPI001C06D3A4|nr:MULTISPECIES: hypothetical protein [Acidithiobacillus]MBU2847584.1 hypothetical protein [Acidithiobacillus ferriphilus]MDA8245338.1 hypothetical protein [Acidithiobacillus sp.]